MPASFSTSVVSLAASRQAEPGGRSRCSGLRCAQTSLWCSGVGCAAELATRCALRSNSRGEHVTARAFGAPTLPHALLAAAEIAPAGPRLPRSRVVALCRWRANCLIAKLRLRACRPGGASGTPSSARVSVGARQRASCSDSPRLFERSAQRVASSAARPNPEQRRVVAEGDRFSEAPGAACPQAQLCREVWTFPLANANTNTKEPPWA